MSKEKASSRINGRANGSNARSNRGGSSVVLLLPVFIIVAIIGVAVFVLTRKEPEPNVVITAENVQEVIEQMKEEEKTPVGSYEVLMTTDWHFEDGKSASKDAYVENPAENTNTVYFTLTRSDTGEEILKSPYIPVGGYLSNITLDTPLPAGTYDTVMTYHLVDESHKELSRVSVSVTVIINK